MSNTPRIQALDHLASTIIDKLPSNGHTAARKLHAEVVRLRNGAEALGKLHATRDPMASNAAHEKRVATAAQKFANEVNATRDRMQGVVRDGLIEIEGRIKSKIKLEPDSYAAEIRAAFRSLESGERFKLLGELVEANRGPELAAIVKAPAILTGISAELQGRYVESIISRHAPVEHAEEKALLEALSTALVATPVAHEAAEAYSDPAKLASIERGEAAAAAAVAAFTNALGV